MKISTPSRPQTAFRPRNKKRTPLQTKFTHLLGVKARSPPSTYYDLLLIFKSQAPEAHKSADDVERVFLEPGPRDPPS